jgi:hypothetical protein
MAVIVVDQKIETTAPKRAGGVLIFTINKTIETYCTRVDNAA